MGNEASNFQAHSGLSTKEIETLKKSFPKTPTNVLWHPWTEVFESEQLCILKQSLVNNSGVISFQNYQQLAGDVGKGGIENQIKFLFKITGVSTETLTTESLKASVTVITKAFCKSVQSDRIQNMIQYVDADCLKFASSMIHDLVFKNEKRKNTFHMHEESNNNIDFSDIEKIFICNPLIEGMFSHVLNHCFQLNLRPPPKLLPTFEPKGDSTLSLLHVLFLNSYLPHEKRNLWRPLFNSDVHGESFAKFTGSIMNQGPSIIIVWDDSGNIFGGYASDSWKMGPKFYGKADSFLFHLHPKMNIYDSTPFNTNYQYFNLKQKTMPNGLGMGGQLEYFGFWIDSEFGLVKTSPTCSTYHSAPLGQPEGKIVKLEVIGIGELDEEDMEAGRSVLDLDPEAQAVLEMMGKTFHSKVIREVDEDNDRKDEILKQVKEQEK